MEQDKDVAGQVQDGLRRLDGTNASVVSLLTGLSREQLDELGGVPEDPPAVMGLLDGAQ